MRSSRQSKMFPSAQSSASKGWRRSSPSPSSGRVGWGLCTLQTRGKPPIRTLAEDGEGLAGSGLRRYEPGGLVDLVDEVLAEAAPHFLVDRHQLGDPGLLLLVGEVVKLELAGGLDLFERLVVVLRGGLVEIVGRFFHGALQRRLYVSRQAVPELLVGDERIGEPPVIGHGEVFLYVVELLRPDVGRHIVPPVANPALQRLFNLPDGHHLRY